LITLSVSDHCNLHCLYCFNDGTPITESGNSHYLSIEEIAEIARWICDRVNSRTINWVFTGGEPMLLPASYYHAAISEIKKPFKEKKPGTRLEFSMQSNLTLLNDNYLSLLEYYKRELNLGI